MSITDQGDRQAVLSDTTGPRGDSRALGAVRARFRALRRSLAGSTPRRQLGLDGRLATSRAGPCRRRNAWVLSRSRVGAGFRDGNIGHKTGRHRVTGTRLLQLRVAILIVSRRPSGQLFSLDSRVVVCSEGRVMWEHPARDGASEPPGPGVLPAGSPLRSRSRLSRLRFRVRRRHETGGGEITPQIALCASGGVRHGRSERAKRAAAGESAAARRRSLLSNPKSGWRRIARSPGTTTLTIDARTPWIGRNEVIACASR